MSKLGIGKPGSKNGEFDEPRGLVVPQRTSYMYAVNELNHWIQVFNGDNFQFLFGSLGIVNNVKYYMTSCDTSYNGDGYCSFEWYNVVYCLVCIRPSVICMEQHMMCLVYSQELYLRECIQKSNSLRLCTAGHPQVPKNAI